MLGFFVVVPWLLLIALAVPAPAAVQARVSSSSGRAWATEGHQAIRTVSLKPNILPVQLGIGADGELLLAGESGAGWFDGHEFKSIPLPKYGVYSNWIVSAGRNDIFVATNGAGVVRYKDGVAIEYSSRTGRLPFADAVVVERCGDDSIWIGGSAGLAQLTLSTDRTAVEPAVTGLITALACHPDGLWIGTEAGLLLRAADGGITRFTRAQGLPNDAVRSLYADAQHVYVGTDRGIAQLAANHLFAAMPGTTNWPNMIYQVTPWAGQLWALLYERGIGQMSPGDKWTVLSPEEGVPATRVRALRPAQPLAPEVMWGTADTILFKMVQSGWRWFSSPSQLAADDIEDLFLDRSGDMWLATGSGFGHCTATQCTSYKLTDPEDQGVIAIGEVSVPGSAEPVMMFGTVGGKVLQYDHKDFRLLDVPNETGNSIRAIAETTEVGSPNSLWLGRKNGLLRRQGGRWKAFDKADGLASGWIQGLLSVPTGKGASEVWCGTYEGVSVYRAGKWHTLGVDQGLPNPVAQVMALDAARNLVWVGTPGGLVAVRIDDLKVVHSFSSESKPALRDDGVSGVRVGPDQSVWVTSNQGATRISADLKQSIGYTVDDGLPSESFYMRSMVFDAEGRLFTVSDKGVMSFDPRLEAPLPAATPVRLTRIGTRARELLLQPEVQPEIAYDEGGLQFEYSKISFRHSEEVQYQTQLVGLEQGFGPWSSDRKREFASLPAGTYELQVRGRDHLARETDAASFRFTILPAPWKTWWAYASYALVLLGSGLGAARYRLRQLKRRAEELEQEVQKRTVEIRMQKDEIELQRADLEASHKQADRIFNALKQAMPGRIINDRYQIGDLIGEGGFGAVYRGQNLRDSGTFAIKIFKPQAGNDSPEALERFKGEAKNASRVEHPNAVKIFDYGVSDDGVAFIVMDLLLGHSIEWELKMNKTFPVLRALRIIRDTCDVLALAHELGIIHRDVKPDNIFLHRESPDSDEVVKVLDFGVAKAMKGDVAKRSITMTGAVVGTPTYMAPERLQDDNYDGRSDLYSVGIILYEMLCGRPPFESRAENVFSVVMAHLTQAPPLMTEFDASIPKPVQEAVMAALCKNPAERPNAREYREWMDRLITTMSA